MATSGSFDFKLNRNEMVNAAFRLIGGGVRGETLSDEDMANGVDALNLMIKHWTTQGLQLWKQQRIVVFMQPDQRQYSIGPSGDHACLESDFVRTQIATAAVSTATTLVVDSTTGMAASDFIMVEQDDGTQLWTTIVSVDSSTGLTITDALTDDVAVDNEVWTYTSKPQRPLKLVNPFIRRYPGRTDTNVWMVEREKYRGLSGKVTSGSSPNQIYHDPQLTTGQLFVYPVPSEPDQTLHLSAHYPFEDMDAITDDFDFPQEWLNALRYNLAVELLTEYSCPPERANRIERRAIILLDEVLGWDQEEGSLHFGMEASGWR